MKKVISIGSYLRIKSKRAIFDKYVKYKTPEILKMLQDKFEKLKQCYDKDAIHYIFDSEIVDYDLTWYLRDERTWLLERFDNALQLFKEGGVKVLYMDEGTQGIFNGRKGRANIHEYLGVCSIMRKEKIPDGYLEKVSSLESRTIYKLESLDYKQSPNIELYCSLVSQIIEPTLSVYQFLEKYKPYIETGEIISDVLPTIEGIPADWVKWAYHQQNRHEISLIVDNYRMIRQRLKLSQTILSEITGLSQSAISILEKGKAIKKEHLVRYCYYIALEQQKKVTA